MGKYKLYGKTLKDFLQEQLDIISELYPKYAVDDNDEARQIFLAYSGAILELRDICQKRKRY